MLLGAPGNGIVLYVNYFKWKKSSSAIFILFLAALDMLNCVTTLPTEIVIMRYSLIFNIPWLCKISRFATYFLNTASAPILVAIATDRYRRICRPWDNQFSASVSKYICIGCIFFASFLTWPVLVFYATRYVTLGRSVGTACLLENAFDSSSYPHIYFVFMMSLTILVIVMLSVLYYFVGLQIYKHALFKQRRCSQGIAQVKNTPKLLVNIKPSNRKANEDIELVQPFNEPWIQNRKHKTQNEIYINKTNRDKTASVLKSQKVKIEQRSIVSNRISTCMCECSKDNEVIRTQENFESGTTQNNNSPQTSVNFSSSTEPCGCKCVKLNVRMRIGKSTLMLFLITLAYIISFLPYYTLAIIRQSNEDFSTYLSDSGYVTYHVFLRSYQLSSAINPIIYSFCNVQFRSFALNLFRRKRQNSV